MQHLTSLSRPPFTRASSVLLFHGVALIGFRGRGVQALARRAFGLVIRRDAPIQASSVEKNRDPVRPRRIGWVARVTGADRNLAYGRIAQER